MNIDIQATTNTSCVAVIIDYSHSLQTAVMKLSGCVFIAMVLAAVAYPCSAQSSAQIAEPSSSRRNGIEFLAQGQPGPPEPALPPSYPPASNKSILKQGTQLIDAGRLQEALALFQNYSRNKPQEASGYFWIGICFDEMGNYPNAVQAYRDALSRAEQTAMDSSEIRMNLGNSLLKQNELDQAIDAYKKALEVNPLYGLAELNLGRAYIAKNDFQSALTAFAKCEELHFSTRQLPYYKAKALLGLGRKDEAGAVVQRLLLDLPAGESKNSIQQEFQSCLPADK